MPFQAQRRVCALDLFEHFLRGYAPLSRQLSKKGETKDDRDKTEKTAWLCHFNSSV
jgi:hypothetical protein